MSRCGDVRRAIDDVTAAGELRAEAHLPVSTCRLTLQSGRSSITQPASLCEVIVVIRAVPSIKSHRRSQRRRRRADRQLFKLTALSSWPHAPCSPLPPAPSSKRISSALLQQRAGPLVTRFHSIRERLSRSHGADVDWIDTVWSSYCWYLRV